jgi:hypothetical protein
MVNKSIYSREFFVKIVPFGVRKNIPFLSPSNIKNTLEKAQLDDK